MTEGFQPTIALKRTLSDYKLIFPTAGQACTSGADIAIVVDKSMSVGEENLKNLKNFLVKFVDSFDVSKTATRIAMLTFNEWVNVLFNLKRFDTKGEIKKSISQMSNKLEWQTRTDRALRKVEQEIFTPNGGDRPDRPNYLFVFTDAKPTGQGKPFFEPISKIVPRLEVRYCWSRFCMGECYAILIYQKGELSLL